MANKSRSSRRIPLLLDEVFSLCPQRAIACDAQNIEASDNI